MGTRETRRQRGQRLGEETIRKVVSDLRAARQNAGVSQRQLARELGCGQSDISRLETFAFKTVPLLTLSEVAAVLGMQLNVGVRPVGDPVHDSAQQGLISRFRGIVAPTYQFTREALLPNVGDRRSWDVLLRRESLLVGVEAETRIRDVQALVRKIRERERDGGAAHDLLILSDTAHNRLLVGQLREALGARFATEPRSVIAALRAGLPVPGSAVLVI